MVAIAQSARMSSSGTTQTFRAPPRCVSLALRLGHSHQESQLALGAVGQRIRRETAGVAGPPTPPPGVPPPAAGELVSDPHRQISDFLLVENWSFVRGRSGIISWFLSGSVVTGLTAVEGELGDAERPGGARSIVEALAIRDAHTLLDAPAA